MIFDAFNGERSCTIFMSSDRAEPGTIQPTNCGTLSGLESSEMLRNARTIMETPHAASGRTDSGWSLLARPR